MDSTLKDLLSDQKEVSTDLLVELAHANRTGTEYQDEATLLAHLPVVLRAISDYVLSDEMHALDTAYALASLVDAIEHRLDPPSATRH